MMQYAKKERILICGLPGSGKSTLGRALQTALPAVHWDGDAVRSWFPGLGFSPEDRLVQASRVGTLALQCALGGANAVASLVAPSKIARQIFLPTMVIWMDPPAGANPRAGRYPDTLALWEDPKDGESPTGRPVLRFTSWDKTDRMVERVRKALAQGPGANAGI